MLKDMIQQSKSFQEKSLGQRESILALASQFEADPNYLFLSPEELTDKTHRGSKESWSQFLTLEPVRNYIKSEMARQAQIAQRKTFRTLQNLAESGNVQAAKEINELSGIMAQSDNNRVIVLHRIERPKTIQ